MSRPDRNFMGADGVLEIIRQLQGYEVPDGRLGIADSGAADRAVRTEAAR